MVEYYKLKKQIVYVFHIYYYCIVEVKLIKENFMIHYKRMLFTAITLFFIVPAVIIPQNDDGLYQQFKNNFKKEYFSIEMLLQGMGDYQEERVVGGQNGFSVPNARFRVNGNLDKGFRYDFQINMVSTRPLIDASVSYKYSDALTIDAGMYKSPFSYEFLVSEAKLDFINRANAVNILGTGRQVGVKARGAIAGKLLSYHGGVFNGRAIGSDAADKYPLFILRLQSNPVLDIGVNKGNLIVGGNIAYNKVENGSYINNLITGFNGKRLLIGADIRLSVADFLFSSEYIRGEYKPETGVKTVAQGFHLTAGYNLLENTQVLVRYDNFKPAENLQSQNILLLGVNQTLTEAAALQFNYILDTDNSDFAFHRMMVVFQIFI